MKSNKTGAKHTKRTNIRKIGKFSNPYVNEIGIHHFDDGTEALIFDVGNPNALNQIIGYAKFINADYGNVYYRGETELHSSVLPSIAREAGHQKYEESLNRVIAAAIADEQFTNCAKLSKQNRSNHLPTIFPKICFFPSSYRWITTMTVSPVLKSESS